MENFDIWNYYKRVISTSDMKKAECRLCYNALSYTSTIHNLKSHLRNKHAAEIPGIESHISIKTKKKNSGKRGIIQSFIWEYFSKIDDQDGMATCKMCQKDFSFKTTLANLKHHLFHAHVEEIEISEESDVEETAESPKSVHTDPDARYLNLSDLEEPKSNRRKSSKLWKYFLKDSTDKKQAKCLTCKGLFSYKSTTYNLSNHLKNKHIDLYEEYCISRRKLYQPLDTTPVPLDNSQIVASEDSDLEEPKSTRRKTSRLWKYFLKDSTNKKQAKCLTCKGLFSYKSTNGNLSNHLKNKHIDLYKDYCINREELNQPLDTTPVPLDNSLIVTSEDSDPEENNSLRKNTSLVWNYFKKDKTRENLATCITCGAKCSYKSSINNLMVHLKCKHLQIYDKLCHLLRTMTTTNAITNTPATDSQVSLEDSDDDDSNHSEPWMEVDVEKFFTVDGLSSRASCEICHANVDVKGNSLVTHLKREHPKILKPANDDSDAAEPDELYQEIVYLYDSDSKSPKNVRSVKLPSSTPASSQKQKAVHNARQFKRPSISLENRKRPRTQYSDTTPPVDQFTEELENFGKYLTCLMRTVPEDLCTQLQMDIINLIMTAKIKYRSKSEASTSQKPDGVSTGAFDQSTMDNEVSSKIDNASLPSLESNMGDMKTDD